MKGKKLKGKDAAKFTGSQQEDAPAVQTTSGGSILSDQTFDSLDICEETKSGISDLGFKMMTLIQSKTIVPLLSGKDLLAQARTGSGKTLAFLIPCIELLHKSHFAQRNGTGVIVLSPTRELSLQTYSVAREVHSLLLRHHILRLFRHYRRQPCLLLLSSFLSPPIAYLVSSGPRGGEGGGG